MPSKYTQDAEFKQYKNTRSNLRAISVLVILGACVNFAAAYFILHGVVQRAGFTRD